jgi:hypothetical protein
MLKKSTLAVLVAASLLTSQSIFADNSVKKTGKIEKEVPVQQVQSKQYDVSTIIINFQVNDKFNSSTDDFFKIDKELSETKGINEVFENYGKVLSSDAYVTNVVAGIPNKFSYNQTVPYIGGVTDNKQQTAYLNIKSWQNLFIRDTDNGKSVIVYLDLQKSQLDALAKSEVGEGSNATFIENPTTSSYSMEQAVKVNLGSYKLANLSSNFDNGSANKNYRAVIIKVTEAKKDL